MLIIDVRSSMSQSGHCGAFISFYFFPTLGVGLLDFKLNSSPRPELFSSPGLLLGVPNPQSVPGVPNSRVCLECPNPQSPSRVSPECPAPESPWSAQPQSPKCPRIAQPNPRAWTSVFPATPESSWSAQPRLFLECPTPKHLYQERVGRFEVKCLQTKGSWHKWGCTQPALGELRVQGYKTSTPPTPPPLPPDSPQQKQQQKQKQQRLLKQQQQQAEILHPKP